MNDPKLPCENCRTDKNLNDIWWCTVCQGTVCSSCAMKSHHDHHCTTWESMDVVNECVTFYQSVIGKRHRHEMNHEREAIHAFCTNMENDLLDFLNQEAKAREGLKRILQCFNLLTPSSTSTLTPNIPLKLDKKLNLISNLMKSYDHEGLDDLVFDFNDDRRNYELQLPKLERIVELCFIPNHHTILPASASTVTDSRTVSQNCSHKMNLKGSSTHTPAGSYTVASESPTMAPAEAPVTVTAVDSTVTPAAKSTTVKFNFKTWTWPIIIVLLVSFSHPLVFPDQLYSTEMTSKYVEPRKTQNLHILYYVKSDFYKHFDGNLKILEQQIDEDFVNSLRNKCFDERKLKETSMWRSKLNKDIESYENAKHIRTPHCDKLSDILLKHLSF